MLNFLVILLCLSIQRTNSINYTSYTSHSNEVYTFEDRQPRFFYPYEYARDLQLDARAQEFAGKIQFKYYKFVDF